MPIPIIFPDGELGVTALKAPYMNYCTVFIVC